MIHFKNIMTVILFALTVNTPNFALANQNDKILKIGGTGAALGGMKLLAKAFKNTIQILKSKSCPAWEAGGGLKALAAGAIDIAVTARSLKKKEEKPEKWTLC